MLRNLIIVGFWMTGGLNIVIAAAAQPAPGPKQSVQVSWDVLDGGGGLMCSPSYSVGGSAGQVAPGVSVAVSRRVAAGYWAGIDALPACEQGGEFIRADANADTVISMGDAIYTLRYLYVPGSEVPSCVKSADSDDNGRVAMSDAIYTLRHLYVPGSPPPPPPCCAWPIDCGSDPTADTLSCGSHEPCTGVPAKVVVPSGKLRTTR